MLTSATVTSIHALSAEPGIHPVAAQMRDIILSKAVDGEPTMEEDLSHFTLAEIKTHFPQARTLAHRQIVRQVDDSRGFETRAQLLTRATTIVLGLMPDDAAMHNRLRANGLSNAEVAELWPDLLETSADAFKRSRATPLAQQVRP